MAAAQGADEPVRLVDAARELGWDLDPPTRAFLRTLAAAMDERRGWPRVAVLASRGDDRLARVVARARPRARVTKVDASSQPAALHVAMAAGGRFDVVVDDTRRGRDREVLFCRCFGHLRPQGTYLVRDLDADAAPGGQGEGVLAHVTRLARLAADPPPRSEPPRGGRVAEDEAALAGTVGAVTVEHDHLVVRLRGRVWAKLSEEEVDGLLELRSESAGRVLRRRPPLVFESRGTLRQSPFFRDGPPSRQEPFPASYDVPAVSLREYHDVVCLKAQVAVLDNVVLPDTYRKPLKRRLRNRRVRDIGPRFGVPKGWPGSAEVRDLEGPLFYLDSEYRGHYGHAMTEQLSRLWAWQEAKQREPELRALMLGTGWSPRLKDFERTLYAAAGVDPSDLLLADGPVRVQRLLAATPMFSQPFYVHPGLVALWDRVGGTLAQAAPERDYPSRFFCGRRGAARACRNPADLEAIFAARGFEIVYPEDFSLPEQVRMFRDAEVVAGYAGSALFTLCLAGAPKHVVMVAPDSYIARNEHLMASALGHTIDVVWSASEIRMPDDGFSAQAFASGFTFDVHREGRYLADLLDSLTSAAQIDGSGQAATVA
jgi:capsular polysaccharide biosynthesis protein